jgi:HK97 family phage prohead protease
MPMKLLSADDFRSAAKDGGQPDGTVFRFATTEPQNVEGATRTKRFVFSDATIDHAGDSIDAKGWDLSIFNENPVALWSHDSSSPPIGRASNVGVQKGKLVGDIEFAPPEVSAFADSIYRLVDGGYLNAVSVGFRPKDWAFSKDKDRPYGIDFKSQVLLEISVCSVPCNPSALQEARSMGIDTAPLLEWAEKVLDSGDTVFLPRKELETLRGQAGAPARKYYLQTSGTVSADAAQSARDSVKAWENDPTEVLALPEGIMLRTIGEANETVIHGDVAIEPKAGRRVSAATRAKLMQAIAMHGDATKCVMEAMGEDDGDGEDPEDGSDNDEPEGSVVLESDTNLVTMTPAELRMKEARELRAAIPVND